MKDRYTKIKKSQLYLHKCFVMRKDSQNDRKIFIIAKYLYSIGECDDNDKYILAICFMHGIGTRVNEHIALDLFIQISDSPYMDSLRFQKDFAYLLEKHHNRACLFWYHKASLRGDRNSNFRIAEIVRNGSLLPDIGFNLRYMCARKYYYKTITANPDDYFSDLSKRALEHLQTANNERRLQIRQQNAIINTLL